VKGPLKNDSGGQHKASESKAGDSGAIDPYAAFIKSLFEILDEERSGTL
jgi:hypothetical protein